MVDFKKLLGRGITEKFDYVYRCMGCNNEVTFITKVPSHLQWHGFSKHDKCKGRLLYVRKEPRP